MNDETKKAVSVLDRETKSLNKALAELLKVSLDMDKLVNQSADLVFNIELKSQELDAIENSITEKSAEIDKKIAEKKREAIADLNIAVKENEKAVLTRLLTKNAMASISETDLKTLRAKLELAEQQNAEKVEQAVADCKKELTNSYQSQIANIKAQQSVETAELKSMVDSLRSRVDFLQDSNDKLQKMLDNEREARVQIAQNTASPIVNVGQQK